MKKILYSVFLVFIFVLFASVVYLSTIGLETSKFNELIISEIKKRDSKIDLNLEKIKIKLDIRKFQLFLSTNTPKIIYQNIKVPITEVKIYSKINKILISKIEINQIIFDIEKFKIKDMQKAAIRIKPSNFKTYLLNNLDSGEVKKASFNLNIDENFKITDYKIRGSIKKIDVKIINNSMIKNLSFNFIVDNNLTLINSINANYKGVLVSNGSIDLQREEEIKINGKFNSKFDFKDKQINKLFSELKFLEDKKIETKGAILHTFDITLDKNFKIIDYNYKSNGDIFKSKVVLNNNFKNNLLEKTIKEIFFEKTKIEIKLNKKNNNLLLNGFYKFGSSNFHKFKFKNNLNKKNQNYFIDLNFAENIFFDLINYKTTQDKVSNIRVQFSTKNKKFIIKEIDFKESKNTISVKGLVLNNKNEIEKISSIKVLTFDKNEENNNFIINFGKKISVSGKKYDSSNLLNLLSKSNKSNLLKNFSKDVEVQIKSLITKSKIPLKNFNLIGVIDKGKFSKVSAKSELSENKYLDISLKKDPNNKKILEVYSDNPQALLGDYKFFEGIKDGKLLYYSVIDDTGSSSKLIIENFKVIKAPAFATLLTLADLGGVADLLTGEGMSFNILEINLEDDNKVISIEEILALGSSVSLHMDGYMEKKSGLVSLSGTLVPAKTLNNLVSKIPVVGNILVGEKVGEGIFGVSFKIKGLPGNVKTTVNPVKTITPRFITRALEKIKKK